MELREHDRRLVRLETKVEMAQKDSSTNKGGSIYVQS